MLFLRRMHRTTTIRIIRGYWMISYTSVSVLVVSSPFEFQALVLRRVYKNLRGLGSGGDSSPDRQAARDARGEAKNRRYGSGGAPTYSSRIRSGPTGLLGWSFRTGKFGGIVVGHEHLSPL